MYRLINRGTKRPRWTVNKKTIKAAALIWRFFKVSKVKKQPDKYEKRKCHRQDWIIIGTSITVFNHLKQTIHPQCSIKPSVLSLLLTSLSKSSKMTNELSCLTQHADLLYRASVADGVTDKNKDCCGANRSSWTTCQSQITDRQDDTVTEETAEQKKWQPSSQHHVSACCLWSAGGRGLEVFLTSVLAPKIHLLYHWITPIFSLRQAKTY